MHVCMLPTSFEPILPQTLGAINDYIFNLSLRLSAWDKVTVLGRGNGTLTSGSLRIESFSYSFPQFFSKYPMLRDFSYSSLFSRYIISSIQKINKEQPIHILHINNLYESPVAVFCNKFYNIKTVCSVHNVFKSPLLIGSCDRILANSYFIKNFLVEDAHLDPRKIGVLPIAVDTDLFKPVKNAKKQLGLEGRNVLLFMGRKTVYKGPQVLIDALPKICKSYPKTLAIFIGPDSFFGSNERSFNISLEERAKKLGVGDNIVMKGMVSDSELRMHLNASDLFVCPSIWQEPFGKVVIEANACEKPVVASRVGGIPELIKDGVNGYLVTPNKADELADAIIRVLADKEAAASMGLNGRQNVVKHYSYGVVSEKCQQIYEQTLD